MPNRSSATSTPDKSVPFAEQAKDLAEGAYGAAKQAVDATTERLDELSRFGKQRPLLAMGVAFLAGFFVAKTFL